ncbi:MAG: CRISPR-associated endonuclease Cas1 [bacterium]
MNALWLTRMCAYKHSRHALESAKRLIELKIVRESILLQRYRLAPFVPDFSGVRTMQDILLVEARAARYFWKAFRDLLPGRTSFPGRQPGSDDPVNRLLDIGYHHLTGIVRRYLEERGVSAVLGLLHSARKSASAPLAYDLVEIFRADTVDAEILRFFRLKKKPVLSATAEIAHFLHELNERLDRPHYLKNFKRCHAYRYYMEVQILKFIRAVDRREPFSPLFLPARHDSRCCTSSDTYGTPPN